VFHIWKSKFTTSTQIVLVRCSVCHVKYHHWTPLPFIDDGVVADRMTDTHNAMVNCLFVASRSYINKGFQLFLQVEIRRIEFWRAWWSCSVSSSTWLSVTIVVGYLVQSSQCARAPSGLYLPVHLPGHFIGNPSSVCLQASKICEPTKQQPTLPAPN
jgi:hypothetical protein